MCFMLMYIQAKSDQLESLLGSEPEDVEHPTGGVAISLFF